MCTIEDFKQWVKNDVCQRRTFEDIVKIVANEGKVVKDKPDCERKLRIRIYTNTTCYGIVAIERSGKRKSYLGCQTSSRKPRAGEDWTRGNDLADGNLSKETWDKIKNDIIAYELVKIAKLKQETL